MYTLNDIKQGERLRKNYREKLNAANAEIEQKKRKHPLISKTDKALIEDMLSKIQEFNDYTFSYNEEVELVKSKYPHAIKTENDVFTYLQKHSSSWYTHANRTALDLKQNIRRIFLPYKQFQYEYPDQQTLGTFTNSTTYQYNSIDPYITKVERQLETMLNWGETQIKELTDRGVNVAKMLGYKERD
ncbi:hypothetical protein PGH26_13650 [Sporosarcina jeotgali]|uniref:Uncharacterized protein n=1 Tax=Sporosarcina jeotgali TaxID=3020056 RepID=A0ABZ0KV46_9BACL|nr:hypothetical protein [Sporosarcina sp. B2O-1]WOV83909.1 hypothetical protein PGH26_13650 [Sporosarcina sp. B2O-1]